MNSRVTFPLLLLVPGLALFLVAEAKLDHLNIVRGLRGFGNFFA